MAPSVQSNRIGTWVSKTDLTRFVRCPYAFYLIDSGQITFEDAVTEQVAARLAGGINFHVSVERDAAFSRLEPDDLPKPSLTSERVSTPVLRNRKLKICGQPDAIDTEHGALVPVEIKFHKDVQRLDELELAFYWMLLEPYRTRMVSPRGILILHRTGLPEPVEVEIKPRRFEEVQQYLADVRDARRNGVRPRICSCTVCIERPEARSIPLANKDLTLVWDVGLVYARLLEEIGITAYDHLLKADSAEVVQEFRERCRYVSIGKVDRWKHHAKSYVTQRPVVFGDIPRLGDSFVALDLEYSPEPLIWLLGVCVVSGDGPRYVTLWADTAAQEKRNLMRLRETLATNRTLPVITWSGMSADVPWLRAACQRHGLGKVLTAIKQRHLDLYQQAVKAVRFPTPRFCLGQLAEHFGIPKTSSIRDGLEAQSRYYEYRSCRSQKKRKALKSELLQYNRDDLRALVGVAQRIAALRPETNASPP